MSYDPANNRIAGVDYDDAGNLLEYNGLELQYDAEGRNTLVTGAGTISYAYDGEGRRVRKIVTPTAGPALTTYFAYDAMGRLAAEYSNQAPVDTGIKYMFSDMLGSVRAIASTAGVVQECYDYRPFGQMLNSGDNGRSACFPAANAMLNSRAPQKFTGKERDAETGLDYFGARYFSAPQGRFTSPDPLLNSGRPSNPQSWNRYAYTLNNPLKYTDPTGLFEWDVNTLGGSFSDEELRKRAGKNKVLRSQADAIIDEREAIRKELKHLAKSKNALLQNAAGAIGAENADNGVTISMGSRKARQFSSSIIH